MEAIHVLLCVDQNYTLHIPTVAKSILTNTQHPIVFHIIHDRLQADTIKKISEFLSPKALFQWYPADQDPILDLDGPLHYISRATYLRLTADYKLPSQVERVIYLDVDTIVLDDISKLWRHKMGERPLAATSNPGVDPYLFAEQFGLGNPSGYFNAGVIVMNLKLVRRLNLLAHAREIAVCNKLEYGDQDAMNIGFWNNWSDFGERWNFQRKSLYLSEIPRKLPSIIHFSDEQKPWRRSDWHPYAWQYLRVLSQTPFAKQICKSGGLTWGVRLYWFLRWQRHLLKRKLAHRRRYPPPEHSKLDQEQRPSPRQSRSSRSMDLADFPPQPTHEERSR
jgi:lipopolysaccharide biosynthesis glycosyltransferase